MKLPKHILITGAAGNLGFKLARALTGRCELTLLDRAESAGVHSVDLSRWDAHWPALFRGVDAVVHLAGNPVAYHDWPELVGPNIDAMLNMFEAAARERVKRVVFASSNHVMGGYQEIPGISITESLPPRPGLRYFADGAERFSGAYAASKLIGERTSRHFAEARGLEVIAVRIGWVWRGQNEPSQLPAERGDWFRNMWLSDRDFVHLMERCLSAAMPMPFVIINGMSANTGMRWDLKMARDLFDYQPQDDVFCDSR